MQPMFLEDNLAMTIEEWLRYHQDHLHFHQQYRGLQMIKNPFDLVVYEEILWEVKPTVIIEIGSWQGGLTRWLCDRMQMIGTEAKIITIDITPDAQSNLKSIASDHCIALVGDCNAPEILSTVRAMISLEDRVLVIEDSARIPLSTPYTSWKIIVAWSASAVTVLSKTASAMCFVSAHNPAP